MRLKNRNGVSFSVSEIPLNTSQQEILDESAQDHKFYLLENSPEKLTELKEEIKEEDREEEKEEVKVQEETNNQEEHEE